MKTLNLFFYVNGTETKVTVKTNQLIRTIANRALKQTELSPRPNKPLDEWMVIYKDKTIPFDKNINDTGIQTHEQVFLIIKSGVGA